MDYDCYTRKHNHLDCYTPPCDMCDNTPTNWEPAKSPSPPNTRARTRTRYQCARSDCGWAGTEPEWLTTLAVRILCSNDNVAEAEHEPICPFCGSEVREL